MLIIFENIIFLVDFFSPSAAKAYGTAGVLAVEGVSFAAIVTATIIASKKPGFFFTVAMIVYVVLVAGQVTQWRMAVRPPKAADCAKKIAFFKDYASYNWNMIKQYIVFNQYIGLSRPFRYFFPVTTVIYVAGFVLAQLDDPYEVNHWYIIVCRVLAQLAEMCIICYFVMYMLTQNFIQKKQIEEVKVNLNELLDSLPDGVFVLQESSCVPVETLQDNEELNNSAANFAKDVGAKHYRLLYCNRPVDHIFGVNLSSSSHADKLELVKRQNSLLLQKTRRYHPNAERRAETTNNDATLETVDLRVDDFTVA